MHKKQKLNLASRIAARQILPLNPLFQNQEQFIAFRKAEEEGTLETYFLVNRKDLPKHKGKMHSHTSIYSTKLAQFQLNAQKK